MRKEPMPKGTILFADNDPVFLKAGPKSFRT
jgi:hypothetical protein